MVWEAYGVMGIRFATEYKGNTPYETFFVFIFDADYSLLRFQIVWEGDICRTPKWDVLVRVQIQT